MSKEEILEKILIKKHQVKNYASDVMFAPDFQVGLALDNFAKQHSIAFLKWFAENEYEFSGFDHVIDEPLFHSANMHNESLETMHDLFIYSLNKVIQ